MMFGFKYEKEAFSAFTYVVSAADHEEAFCFQ
jgi:hypothetical protein